MYGLIPWRFIRAYVLMTIVTAILCACAAPTTMRTEIDPAAAEREANIQRKLQIERQLRDQLRVSSVSYPILKGATSLCGEKVGPAFGALFASTHDFAKEYETAVRETGLRDEVTVALVTKGSPADVAGLTTGDVLKSINDWAVPIGKKATAEVVKRLRGESEKNATVILSVERSGTAMTIPVMAVPVCDFRAAVVEDDTVNAFADGENIVVTSGMLRFVENDQELATVISHELAHNAMKHIDAKTTNYWLGSIFDILAAAYGVNTQGAFGGAAAQAYSKEFEAEADYVGVYALALSDAPLDGVANLWRRMGASTGNIRGSYGASHPGSAERYIAIEGTVQEVIEKRTLELPLTPNLKKAETANGKKQKRN